MKNFLLLYFVALCLSSNLSAQQSNFPIVYDNVLYTDIRGLVATKDGNFVMTGLKKTTDYPEGNMYLKKIDLTGATLWERDFGQPLEDGGNYLMGTNDGGLLISGHIEYSNEVCDGYVVRTDADGRLLWKMTIGEWSPDEVCNGGTQLENGDIYLTGRIGDLATENFDVLLCRISRNGELLFWKKIPVQGSEYGKFICPTDDGNLLISGYSVAENSNQEEMLVMKVNLEGDLLWKRNFNFGTHTRARGLCALPNHTYAITGGTAELPYRKAFQSMKIVVVDNDGNLVKDVSPLADEGRGFLYDICPAGDGHYVASGIFQSNDQSNGSLCMLSLDKDLNILEYSVADTNADSWGYCTVPMGRNDFLIAGRMQGAEEEVMSGIINRFSLQTLQTASPDLLHNALVTPNPFSDFAYLRLATPSYDNTLKIYDINGRLQESLVFYDKVLKLDASRFATGIYPFQVIDNKTGALISIGRLVRE